ncbi:hypothetical protein ACHAXT_008374 [Thalassiosira profunda]
MMVLLRSASTASMAALLFCIINLSIVCDAFSPAMRSVRIVTPSETSLLTLFATDDSFVDTLTKRYEIFQDSRGAGYGFKQNMASVIAGEYDAVEVQQKIQEDIDSAPCVMFTWEASPSCKQAIKYLDIAGANYKIVRLDDPWSEGNKVRAELGKMVGRSSVPCIFMGGKYVGGFDGGVGEESPGLVEMAFKGTLRDKLKGVGALKDVEVGAMQ